ncbi:hypothetical protein HOV93_51650 [Planctomycetes bacterium FF15]|uniref:SprT-like domain-containing protein n=2 Tax=Bremerella alba TaxID=980252 RepID=A0A7V8VAH7_9BACT|nr:hypothetical protein [Bremerella alba]
MQQYVSTGTALSLDQIKFLIFNTCDSDNITDREVRDINYIVRNYPLLQSDRPRIMQLVRRFTSDRTRFQKYRGFSDYDLSTLTNDFLKARHRATACALLFLPLVGGHGFSNWQHEYLLRGTFSINSSHPGVSIICRRFSAVAEYFGKADFVYRIMQPVRSLRNPNKMSIPLAMANRHDDRRYRIFISQNYFNRGSDNFRQSILIHEMIHCLLHHRQDEHVDGHPGAVRSSGGLPLGVRFNQAIGNPYCYQWFSFWYDNTGLWTQIPAEVRRRATSRTNNLNSGSRSPRGGGSSSTRRRLR